MKAIKVKALVQQFRAEFKKLPKITPSKNPTILKAAEEQMASARLDVILDQLEKSNDDANEKSLRKIIEFLTERDRVVGMDYRYDKDSDLNPKCRFIAGKLSSDVFAGKKLWDFLHPTMPKDNNNAHVPANHLRFNEKVFVRRLLTQKSDVYNFDQFHESLKKREELLDVLSHYTSPDDWALFLNHMSLKKLTGLILGVEGKALDDLMRKENYAALMAKLEVEMKNKQHYQPADAVYNRAFQFCVMELYERHRKHQPDHLSTFGYYWGSPDKSVKLELAEQIKSAIVKSDNYKLIVESLASNTSPALKDGFIAKYMQLLTECMSPDFFPKTQSALTK